MTLLQYVRFEGRKEATTAHGSPPSRSREVVSRRREAACVSWASLARCERELISAILRPAGIDPACYRAAPLHRRLRAVLRAVRCDSAAEAVERVAADRRLAHKALHSLVIGHTAPFRDLEVFRALRERVLPKLGSRPLRVWSIGCSRGLELLSVALLLAEQGQLQGSTLRGSDCRPCRQTEDESLARDFLETIPPAFFGLRRLTSERQIRAIIEQIEWRTEDIFSWDPCEAHGWDVVICRNISIYLGSAAAEQLWKIAMQSLAPGGILVTGKAERPTDNRRLSRLTSCIYQYKGENA